MELGMVERLRSREENPIAGCLLAELDIASAATPSGRRPDVVRRTLDTHLLGGYPIRPEA